MALPDFLYKAEAFLGGQWQDITDDVYGHDRAQIHITQRNLSGEYEPGTCSIELNNRSGDYTVDNPNGAYYGSLNVNTPLRIVKIYDQANFTSTVSNAWPATEDGDTWTTTSVGAPINASDYNSTGGKGTHLVPSAVPSWRGTYLANFAYRNVDIASDLSMSASDITGGNASWGFMFWGTSTSDWWEARINVDTNESVSLSFWDQDGFPVQGTYGFTKTVGITHSSGQTLRARLQVEGWAFRFKVWVASSGEPYDWHIDEVHNDEIAFFDGSGDGWVGLVSQRHFGNTNSNLTMSYDNVEILSNEFAGEVSNWPVEWDETGLDVFSTIEATGIMRRIGTANVPITSPPRAFIPRFLDIPLTEVIAYWPMEDGSQAVYSEPLISKDGNASVVSAFNTTKSLSEHWGKGDLAPWLYPVFAYHGNEGVGGQIGQTGFVDTVGWRFDMAIKPGGDQNYALTLQCATHNWFITFKPGTKFIDVRRPDLSTGNCDFTNIPFFDNAVHTFAFHARQSGTGVAIALWIDDEEHYPVTIASTQLQALVSWNIDGSAAFSNGAITSIGHVTVIDEDVRMTTDIGAAVAGFPGELASNRLPRIGTGENIKVYLQGNSVESAPMGPQSLSFLGSQIDEVQKSDFGLVYDAQGSAGLVYMLLDEITNQEPVVTFNYTNKELTPEFKPTRDDLLIANDVTATAAFGGSYRVSLEAGPMSAAPPSEGGVGRYVKEAPVSLNTIDYVKDAAGWYVNLGTANVPRVPIVVINLARSQTPDGIQRITVGSRIDIINAPTKNVGGTLKLLVVGFEKNINGLEQIIKYYCFPFDPYQVLQLDDSENNRIPAGDSFIAESFNSVVTSFGVKSLDNTRWTQDAGDLPLKITIGGEKMSVGAVSNSVPGFIAAGTAAHADNASVTPGLPGGATAAGDALLILAAIRNTAATINMPSEYQIISSMGNVVLFGKIHDGSESAPTVTFSGGSAGDTTSAQMCSLDNVSSLTLPSHQNGQISNSSAQNIIVPWMSADAMDSISIIFGWKQDDWTSVLPPDQWTEIGEPSSTTGNDQGITWAYRVMSGNVNTQNDGFVVTGGGSAVSKAGHALFNNWQTFSSVTRSVNNVIKSHTADDSETARVQVADPVKVVFQ